MFALSLTQCTCSTLPLSGYRHFSTNGGRLTPSYHIHGAPRRSRSRILNDSMKVACDSIHFLPWSPRKLDGGRLKHVATKLYEIALNGFGSILAASIDPVAPSFLKPSILCLHGIRTPKSAMHSSQT